MSAATSRAETMEAGRRPDIESDLTDRYHVKWTFQRDVPIDEFDIDTSLANQARFEAISEPTVELYQEGVERGDIFPPVIAYRRGRSAKAKLVIVDGNHRLVAHQRAGKPIGVYELDRTVRPQTVNLMTYAFNTRHGRPTSEEERVTQAIYLIENGASQDDAAAAVNLPRTVLKRALNRANSDRRAASAGVDPRTWDSLPQSSKNRLGNISTDEGFVGATELALKANLGSEEVFELVSLLNNAGRSAKRQLQVLDAERDRYHDRMQDSQGGLFNKTTNRKAMSPRTRLATAIGQVLSLPDDLMQIASSYGPNERVEAARRMDEAARKLRETAKAVRAS